MFLAGGVGSTLQGKHDACPTLVLREPLDDYFEKCGLEMGLKRVRLG